jgi:S-formylglutathione hydrolase FrmB
LHGYYGDFTDWLYLSNIIRFDKPSDLVLVFPDGSNSYYVDHPKGLKYESYIIEDVIPLIEQTFHISQAKDSRYIAGLSMGGYGALYIGLKHAHMFSKVYGLSSVVYPSDIFKHLSESRIYKFETLFDKDHLSTYDLIPYAIKSIKHEIHISLCIGLNDFLLNDNKSFHQDLISLNIPHTYIEDKGTHNWEFWDTHMARILKELIL